MAILGLLKRELVSQLRNVKTLLCLMLLAIIILVFTMQMWPESNNVQWYQVGNSAKTYVGMVAAILFAGAALFIPGVSSPSLVLERQTNSWDLLNLTLLGPWGIIFGKLLSTIGMFLLLMIGIAPFLCAVFFLVGIDIAQLSGMFYLIFLTTVTCACLGIFASAYSRTTTRAISRGYSLMIMDMGLGYVLVQMLYVLGYILFNGMDALNSGGMPFEPTPAYSTFTMMGFVIGGMVTPSLTVTPYFVKHTIMQVSIIVISLLLTWRKIRKPVAPPVAKKSNSALQAGSAEGPLPLPLGFKPISNRSNPIQVMETRWGIAIRTRYYVGIGAMMIALACLFAFMKSEGAVRMEGLIRTIFWTNLLLMSLFILSNLANIFTKENELKNLDMLKMTTMTPWQIVNGKLRAGRRFATRLTLLYFVVNVWFVIPGIFDPGYGPWNTGDSIYAFLSGLVAIWLCSIICVHIAGFASVICKKTTTAVVLSYALAGMMYGGNLLLLGIASDGMVFSGERPRWAFLASPIFGYDRIVEYMHRAYSFEFLMYYFLLYGIVALVLSACIFGIFQRKFYRKEIIRKQPK